MKIEGVSFMHTMKINRVTALVALLSLAVLAAVSIPTARAHDQNHSPDLPPLCYTLQPQAGNRVVLHAYAVGIQEYRWNGASWAFVEPVATLFADAGYHEK